MIILLTGTAGLIGSKIAEKLLLAGNTVIGIDNLNNYYDVSLKKWRIDRLQEFDLFEFHKIDIEEFDSLREIFQTHRFDAVINEAARAGIRPSLKNPFIYLATNSLGNLNLLELCREFDVPKYVLASTSSLYAGHDLPFTESLPVNTPISPYAASKKSAEAMSYSYHHLYGIDITVFRYFTVYGPAARPDMAVFRFIKWIMEGTPVQVFGDGNQLRDFTYVDDVAEGTILGLKKVGYEIFNIGNSRPEKLSTLIALIEKHSGKKAELLFSELSKSEMSATGADIRKARELLEWQPQTSLDEGIRKTVEWTKENWGWIKDVRI